MVHPLLDHLAKAWSLYTARRGDIPEALHSPVHAEHERPALPRQGRCGPRSSSEHVSDLYL